MLILNFWSARKQGPGATQYVFLSKGWVVVLGIKSEQVPLDIPLGEQQCFACLFQQTSLSKIVHSHENHHENIWIRDYKMNRIKIINFEQLLPHITIYYQIEWEISQFIMSLFLFCPRFSIVWSHFVIFFLLNSWSTNCHWFLQWKYCERCCNKAIGGQYTQKLNKNLNGESLK